MGIFGKARTFFSLDLKTMLLLVEAFFYMGWARLVILYRPFSKVALSLGTQLQETPNTPVDKNKAVLKSVHDAIHIMSKYTFWESKCLVRAIAALKMLEKRRIESTLYLGTTRDETGKMIAHAWLRSGPFFITGAEEMERFAVVGTFAKRICDKG